VIDEESRPLKNWSIATLSRYTTLWYSLPGCQFDKRGFLTVIFNLDNEDDRERRGSICVVREKFAFCLGQDLDSSKCSGGGCD